jgi:hypothetical protein
LVLHRPSIEAFWQARWGVTKFSSQQLREILDVTEFSYEDLLQPFVLFAPLYAELNDQARQRMIVRTWYKEALASFVSAGLGPSDNLGPHATRSVAWICAFSAGVIYEIPPAHRLLCNFAEFSTYLNQSVRQGDGANLQRVWTELIGLVVVLETIVGAEDIFYPHRPRKSSGGGLSNYGTGSDVIPLPFSPPVV